MESNSELVTGVSRSGRVCKKSTKLQDFQSPDEIDTKPKKTSPAKGHLNAARALEFQSPSGSHIESEEGTLMQDESSEESNQLGGNEDDWSSSKKVPHRSIYMQEKSTKRQKLLKDGTIVMSKAQRKDKGKPRFTAYMLWAKETRHQMMETNPDMDFATASKRLGEMWANVPGSQKHQWKRKAKRFQTKIKKNATKAQQAANKGVTLKPMSASTARRAVKRIESEEQLKIQKSQLPPGKKITGLSLSPAEKPQKLPNYQPIDIAAHLKLLGESLECIGERLKEHEGQITVSGSLSVLLDSLLCSLGPLMCLTVQIPELKDKLEHLGPTFSNTLDNIAYVMPGL
uniref:CSON013899 protein n=1 Tax=Culicoides sonorensis TaxID=179676 RepID=A0A336MD36_CULSO